MTTQTGSIADQVTRLKTAMAGQAPVEVLAVFEAEQAELNTAGVPATAAAPGTRLPDVELITAEGSLVSLHTVTGGRPAVIVFYRGAWCPYCNIALKTYQDQLLPALAERGAALVAVSPQRPDGSLTMQQKHALEFPVLSDPGNALAGALGILTAPTAGAREAQAKVGLDLTSENADGTHTVPMPTVVITDANHTVRWIDIHPDYTARSEPAAILAALDAAQ
ncbi:peroxiredoxin [Streptomyces griseochromogenes]|uniref:thioredoxin-dependent peroxiredoxin n=1 Tax=Streptomyces griseochromogenes TaxID=68214 RepID=A0A1B1AV96_9ACTN|nr:peroxiredoxin-like family protein [Streptomyces griseochromogenes]ANP50461.1 peroxiredoxin [Streptomyces griseochromogenes]MBP2047828.1 peroxiredoxin [Streptomyces griseochromogenes]